MKRRTAVVFVFVCGISLGLGIGLAMSEWQTQKVESLATAAVLAASADARETEQVERIAALFCQANPKLDRESSLYYAYAVMEASDRYSIPARVLAGLVYTESRANPAATNRGCYGLTQVHWAVWKRLLVEQHPEIFDRSDLFEPRRSILAGAWILRHYLDRHGDLRKALKAYSGGADWYPAKVLRVAEGL